MGLIFLEEDKAQLTLPGWGKHTTCLAFHYQRLYLARFRFEGPNLIRKCLTSALAEEGIKS